MLSAIVCFLGPFMYCHTAELRTTKFGTVTHHGDEKCLGQLSLSGTGLRQDHHVGSYC